jgi:hypothetical protein
MPDAEFCFERIFNHEDQGKEDAADSQQEKRPAFFENIVFCGLSATGASGRVFIARVHFLWFGRHEAIIGYQVFLQGRFFRRT